MEYFQLGIRLSFTNIIFLFMVLLVTSLVCLFREFYMENYNNKKFFILIFLFFFSMIILCVSTTFTGLIVGWDGLGLRSICLIIFYPNKTTSFNSFLTMIFNRIGDVCLILSFGIRINFHSDNIFLIDSKENYIFILLLIIGSFTKRAQLPLSSWLPAAISAPTPISAIVHSSTLVTAGIFILYSFYSHFNCSPAFDFIIIFSLTTFLIGGSLSQLEVDYKKMVAFSTIRQIRIIIFFCCMGFFMVSIVHTLLHALYKTLLFCSSGVMFLFNIGCQNSKILHTAKLSVSLTLLTVLSIYSIRGLVFCLSFFTKDLLLEAIYQSRSSWLFFIFLLGRVFTLLYCVKMLSPLLKLKYLPSFYYKNYLINFGPLYFILLLISGIIIKSNCLDIVFFISRSDLFLINLFLISFILNTTFLPPNLVYLTLSIFFIKFNSFRIYGRILKLGIPKYITFREYLFLKSKYISPRFMIFLPKKIWPTFLYRTVLATLVVSSIMGV